MSDLFPTTSGFVPEHGPLPTLSSLEMAFKSEFSDSMISDSPVVWEEVRLRFELLRRFREERGSQTIDADNQNSMVRDLIANSSTICMGSYCPLQNYATANAVIRNRIVELKSKISKHFHYKNADKPFCILLCAESGVGKSHLIKCIANSFGSEISFVECDISDSKSMPSTIAGFLKKVRALCGKNIKVLGLVDEADSSNEGEYSYGYFIKSMLSKDFKNAALAFTMSSFDDPKKFAEFSRMLPREFKAVDFRERISEEPSFPQGILNDPLERIVRAIAIACSSKRDATKSPQNGGLCSGSQFDQIDGESVAYLAVTTFSSTHKLQNLIESAVAESPAGERILSLKHVLKLSDWTSLAQRHTRLYSLAKDKYLDLQD